jgi:hypothetical protein
MSQVAFDYLTGVVRLDVARPAELDEDLGEFYRAPNDQRWGDQLCRILYHESIHFWQFLASGYLANIIAAEWRRVEAFRDHGTVAEPSPGMRAFRQRAAGAPFSAYELCECWARFWDVHTRNPETIMNEESLQLTGAVSPLGYGYAGANFDALMKSGVERSSYQAPYLWMLEQLARAPGSRVYGPGVDENEVASYLVSLVFPVVAHSAFASPDPVGVVVGVINRLGENPGLAEEILRHKTTSINFDWLATWTYCCNELVRPVLLELEMPGFTSGFEVIEQGALRTHPLFRAYPQRTAYVRGALTMARLTFEKYVASAPGAYEVRYRHALLALPEVDPWILFAQPGQPDYRYILGSWLPPPCVAFSNANSIPGESPLGRYAMAFGSATDAAATGSVTEETIAELTELVRRFRVAEYAASRRLPVSVFQS